MLAELTDFTLEAQRILRDDSNLAWYVVTLLVLVLYVYAVEVERRRWDIVLAGLAFWLADWINEIVNSLVLHFSDRAALWTVTGDTAYLILIGLCIEISFMFAISGIVYAKSLPPDPRTKLLGMPNRSRSGSASRSSPSPSSCCCTPPASSTGSTGGGTPRSCCRS